MSRFEIIDIQLLELTGKLNAKLSVDRPSYPEALRTFEERRLDWVHNGICKAILIQPNFEENGVNEEFWNFVLVSWSTGELQTRENVWTKNLISNKPFQEIESNIENLLNTAMETLHKIETNDLEPIKVIYLLLDLDGVLITTPSWKADEIEEDGYSKFNDGCIDRLNVLLEHKRIQIWLSSSRRTTKTLNEFNKIFKARSINGRITGFLPIYEDCKNRKEEILNFIKEKGITKYLILDDDNSLNGLNKEVKGKLVKTDYLIGFSEDNLIQAKRILEKRT